MSALIGESRRRLPPGPSGTSRRRCRRSGPGAPSSRRRSCGCSIASGWRRCERRRRTERGPAWPRQRSRRRARPRRLPGAPLRIDRGAGANRRRGWVARGSRRAGCMSACWDT